MIIILADKMGGVNSRLTGFLAVLAQEIARQNALTTDDGKFGDQFERVAEGSGIDVIHTPVEAPKANSICERFIGSVRRGLLDHVLILNERHLRRKVKAYVQYFNRARPHQGINGQNSNPIQSSAVGYSITLSTPAHPDSGRFAS
jgi:transposase InsO family protein